jgi:putative spermidine/putrescine transport system ATP-binding protein
MSEAEGFVRFQRVSKRYGAAVWAVRDLDLEVRRGEFVTFLGPSGSGKTTSLMMLAGFEQPTAGEIRLAGRSLHAVPPYRRDIGMVFQNYALFPHMTVAENIAFPLTVRRRPRAEIATAVARALDLVRLGGMADRRPAQLSGGQQQRVALARALVFDPPLVLMDEPLGALDRQLREQMQIEIKHLHERLGVTLVYVTHDQGEALTMSDRVAVFRDGGLQQVAPPLDLYERPATSFVAQFVGDSNQFAGTVLGVSGTTCTVELDGGWRVAATAVADLAPGRRTTLSIRPERVLAGTADAPPPNAAPARVAELIYHGDHVRAHLVTTTGQALFAKVLSGTDPGWLAVGTEVRIGWHDRDCRALDARPDHLEPDHLEPAATAG